MYTKYGPNAFYASNLDQYIPISTRCLIKAKTGILVFFIRCWFNTVYVFAPIMSFPQGSMSSQHYEFSEYMSIISAMSNVSVGTTLETMKTTMPESTAKQIIQLGIKAWMMQTPKKNQMLNGFKTKLNAITNPISPISDTFTHSALNISQIKCQIFNYLHFYQLIQCSLVSKQWLTDSLHQSSLYEIDTANLFCMEEKQHQYPRYPNMHRFKHVKSLIITAGWREPFNPFFQQLLQFNNIVKLTLNGQCCERWTNSTFDELSNHEELEIISAIMQNNKQRLKSLTVNDGYDSNSEFLTDMQHCWNSIAFPNLEILQCSNNTWLTQCKFIQKSTKLHTIKCIDCEAEDEFWIQLTSNQTDIPKVEKLIFKDTQYIGDDEQHIASLLAIKTQQHLQHIELESQLTRHFYYFAICKNIQSISITISPALYTKNIKATKCAEPAIDYNLNLPKLKRAEIMVHNDHLAASDIVSIRKAVAGIICFSSNTNDDNQTTFIKEFKVSNLDTYCRLFKHVNFNNLKQFHSRVTKKTNEIKKFCNCNNSTFWHNLKHLEIEVQNWEYEKVTQSIPSCLWQWQSQKKTTCIFTFKFGDTQLLRKRDSIVFNLLYDVHIFSTLEDYKSAIKLHNVNENAWQLPNTKIWIKYGANTLCMGVGPICQYQTGV